ncbi:endonuclease/exonuclease/phosphatase family protein [Sutcliffiella horikoshii]|uniref:endonuclease/exonuclease/phosphatase family protein n=1 Tax=Sutcliffiella horikoshii TaxID=79883 RepID=UPI001CBB0D76|nr:endonuclease/exonuclease/phosphatase family protein [Sutcliffiella horikoshii]UAL48210.1 endonuclease/exonuclease/phosphatase family protein [Sutcliffiella horikoshii]
MKHTYTVMSFNLRVIVPTDPFIWEDRKHWIAETIHTYSPDVIGTQEATIPMLEWLKERFKESYEVYAVNRTVSTEVGEFSAVFVKKSSFTTGSKGSFMLSETPDIIGSKGWDAHCERICSWVELIPKGQTEPVLRFFNTHLDHMGKLARKEGLKLIRDVIRSKDNAKSLPVILTGDFNDVPESEALAEVSSMESCYSCFTEEEKEDSLTFHAYEGGIKGSPIDYIFGSNRVEFLTAHILRDSFDGGYPSDHYPVLATVKIL